MLSGASFEDYLVHPQRAGSQDPEAFFLMTSKVHLPTLRHALRLNYKVTEGQLALKSAMRPAMCPASKMPDNSSDAWGHYEDMPWLRSFVSDKCGVTESAVGEAMLVFWDSVVQLPRPQNDIVHYAQGARFAVSRDRIRQRSKAFYERLLGFVSSDIDPCQNYLYEYAWYYMLGKPDSSPCSMAEDEEAQAQVAEVRMLSGGLSGVSGALSGGLSGTPDDLSGGLSGTSGASGSSGSPSLSPTPSPGPGPGPGPGSGPDDSKDSIKIYGSVSLTVDNPVEFCATEGVRDAFEATLAKLLNAPEKYFSSKCNPVTRRLSASRRLAGNVNMEYTITIPMDATDVDLEKIGADTVALLQTLQDDLTLFQTEFAKQLSDVGVTATIKVESISDVTIETSTGDGASSSASSIVIGLPAVLAILCAALSG